MVLCIYLFISIFCLFPSRLVVRDAPPQKKEKKSTYKIKSTNDGLGILDLSFACLLVDRPVSYVGRAWFTNVFHYHPYFIY